jgi:hypothetical protein
MGVGNSLTQENSMAGDNVVELPTETKEREYLLVTDKSSEVIISDADYNKVLKMANIIRKAGGEVTIFKSTDA